MKAERALPRPLSVGILALTLSCAFTGGCFPCGTVAARRLVRGALLDRDTLEPPVDVVKIAVWSSTGGAFTGSVGSFIEPSREDGSFELHLVSNNQTGFCGPTPSNVPAFPDPDEILVIVERETCEQEFTIEINEDTVVDLSFPDDVIELKEPILLPPCGEEGSGE